MPQEKLGIAAAYALDVYFMQYDHEIKHEMIREEAKGLGVSFDDLRKWRYLENYNCLIDSEVKKKIREMCKFYWPSKSQVEEMAETFMSVKEFEQFMEKQWEKEELQKREANRRKIQRTKAIIKLRSKYKLPVLQPLQTLYTNGIRYDKIVELSKSLSMHVPEIIEKYPQCKEIIYNNRQKFWTGNSDVSIVELAKIPEEDLNYDDNFNIFSKQERDSINAPGCVTAIIIIAIMLYVFL